MKYEKRLLRFYYKKRIKKKKEKELKTKSIYEKFVIFFFVKNHRAFNCLFVIYFVNKDFEQELSTFLIFSFSLFFRESIKSSFQTNSQNFISFKLYS